MYFIPRILETNSYKWDKVPCAAHQDKGACLSTLTFQLLCFFVVHLTFFCSSKFHANISSSLYLLHVSYSILSASIRYLLVHVYILVTGMVLRIGAAKLHKIMGVNELREMSGFSSYIPLHFMSI